MFEMKYVFFEQGYYWFTMFLLITYLVFGMIPTNVMRKGKYIILLVFFITASQCKEALPYVVRVVYHAFFFGVGICVQPLKSIFIKGRCIIFSIVVDALIFFALFFSHLQHSKGFGNIPVCKIPQQLLLHFSLKLSF